MYMSFDVSFTTWLFASSLNTDIHVGGIIVQFNIEKYLKLIARTGEGKRYVTITEVTIRCTNSSIGIRLAT
jgi:hypothetical protein